MRILYVIPSLDTGGAQELTGNLLPLLQSDNEIRIIVFKKTGSSIEKRLIRQGFRIESLGISTHSPQAIFKLRKYFKWSEIVHLQLFPTHYFATIANIGLNKPLIFTEHSTHNKRRERTILKPVEKLVYRKLEKIISISEPVEKSLKSWLGMSGKDKKYVVISNGIDLNKFKSAEKKSPKEIFGKDGLPILMIGRFTASKDQATLIKSLNHIVNKKVYLVLVGNGERKKEIENFVIHEGLEDRVVFTGERDDIPDIIKASKIGVLSSHWEGFGLSAVEMMAGGLPVIASNIEGVREIVEGAGFLFNKGDERELALIINQILNDDILYKNYSEKCEQRSTMYSIEKTAKKYLELYKSIFEKT